MDSDFKITLLGTGNPSPRLDRFGPSTLIEAAGQKILIDCGRGTMQRAYQIHQQTQGYDKLFLTHLHSDHTTGIPDLWITGTIMGRHDNPLRIWGPRGTCSMVSYLEKAFAVDLKLRREGEQRYNLDHRKGIGIEAADIDEGFVYEEDGLRVEPFRVNHVDHFSDEPSLGYRIKYGDRSVVLSGDTRFCENLIMYSSGVDLLIHEVAAAPLGADLSNDARYILSLHTQPEECDRLFSRVNPRLAVYTHVIQCLGVSLEEMMDRTRKEYGGRVEFGKDLMRIEVGESVKILQS
ncbi:MAG: MBL fold metallo-hydrolase [Candidatus Bathyarchaeota archaeon]|nr:MBL fold metallo-hydrolase [Candidatus Bathyarchaeota archaeon]